MPTIGKTNVLRTTELFNKGTNNITKSSVINAQETEKLRQIISSLASMHRKMTIQSKYNPFLTQEERKQAQESVDNHFIMTFINKTSEFLPQPKAFEPAIKIIDATKMNLAALDVFFKREDAVLKLRDIDVLQKDFKKNLSEVLDSIKNYKIDENIGKKANNATITCGQYTVSVDDMTKEQKRVFNGITSKLGESYHKETIDGGYNPFLSTSERELAQREADNAFLKDFFRETSGVIDSSTALETAIKMIFAVNESYAPITDYFKDNASIEYLKTAKAISDLKIKMFDLEESMETTSSQMKELKTQYDSKKEEKSKIRTAKRYNTLADKYNKLVSKYNTILTGKYAELVKEQLERRESMKQDFDKNLFNLIYGKEGPKMPKISK